MNINHYNNENGLITAYSDLHYASAPKTEFCSIEEFKNAFIDRQPIPLNFDEIINCPLTPHTFCEIRSCIITGVEEILHPIFEKDIHYALLLAYEWDAKCIVAELDEMYVGYLWETGV